MYYRPKHVALSVVYKLNRRVFAQSSQNAGSQATVGNQFCRKGREDWVSDIGIAGSDIRDG